MAVDVTGPDTRVVVSAGGTQISVGPPATSIQVSTSLGIAQGEFNTLAHAGLGTSLVGVPAKTGQVLQLKGILDSSTIVATIVGNDVRLDQTSTSDGDVTGPASSLDNELVLFDSTTGKLIKGGSGWSVVAGVLNAGGDLAMGANDITLSAGQLVDGVDVSVFEASFVAHAADATIHFTEASISHLSIGDIGVNSHAAIDTHIADATIHFTEASISHLSIGDIGVNSHATIDTHIGDATIHFTEASISHLSIGDIGVNSHATLDTHLADATIHFTEASVDHLNILNIGVNSHAAIDTHIADATLHFTEASIDHTSILNIGVNSHATIDTHLASTSNPHTVTLQQAYDSSGTPDHITVDGTNLAFTVEDNAAPIGSDIFQVRTNAQVNVFGVAVDAIDTGPTGRRLFCAQWPDATGRTVCEVYPDDFSITTDTGPPNNIFFTDASRVITLAIPGGAPFFLNAATAFCTLSHTTRFEEPGFLFSSVPFFANAVSVECAANIGPAITLLDQVNTYADGGARTASQHNTIRSQPKIGPNINGGSIIMASMEQYLANVTVDATVGSATLTAYTGFKVANPTLVAGGLINNFTALEIANISGPITKTGIKSDMATGEFINHTGFAGSKFGGPITIANNQELRLGGATSNDVTLRWSAANTMQWRATGVLQWELVNATSNAMRAWSNNQGLQFELPVLSFGTVAAGPAANWFINYTPPARTTIAVGEWSDLLLANGADVTVDDAITNLSGWKIDAPGITIGTGSVVDASNLWLDTAPTEGTNRYGLLITSAPTGGTLNYALRVTAGDARFDGRLDINRGIALGGGAAPTLGTIGGSGPTAAAQSQWVEIDIGGTPHWIPVWV